VKCLNCGNEEQEMFYDMNVDLVCCAVCYSRMMKKPQMNENLVLESEDGEIDVLPAKLIFDEEKDYADVAHPDSEERTECYLRLNEIPFCLFILPIAEKYTDLSLTDLYREIYSAEDPFDYYGHNLVWYSDAEKMLEQLELTAKKILAKYDDELIRRFIKGWYRVLRGRAGDINEMQQVFDAHRADIADYYDRFCREIRRVMKNSPKYKMLDFWGP